MATSPAGAGRAARTAGAGKTANVKPRSAKGVCAPGSEGNGASCYPPSALRRIARALNSRAAAGPRTGGAYAADEEVDEDEDPATLWEQLRRALTPVCASERCWASQPFLPPADRVDLQEHFRPVRPPEWQANEREWLSNFDIENVLRQYEKRYPSFDLLGVVPVDFAQRIAGDRCVSRRMCDLDVNSLAQRGKTRLACVVNLDPHDRPGSHWVAFCICLRGKNRGTFFYDSVARSPPREVGDFLARIVERIRLTDPHHPFRHNTVRRQYKNTECGVFCMRFLEQLLTGRKAFDDICEEMPYDDGAFELRRRYFDHTEIAVGVAGLLT